jgi:hypothetical protein
MVAAVFVLIALFIVGWKWRHPTAFVNYGGWGVSTRDVPSGSTVYVTVTEPSNYDGGTVTLHGVAAHRLVDSTDAAIGYVLCTPVPGPNTIGIETTAELRRSCDRLVSARDVAMSLQGQQLLLAITPQHAGNIVFQGADVRYSQGWQDGTQRVGPEVRIRVSPAK